MDAFLVQLVLGVSFGFILFLLGTGLSMTMGLMKIVNLAHGGLYMFGAYAGLAAAKYTGNFLVGIMVGGVVTGIIGLIMERGIPEAAIQTTS